MRPLSTTPRQINAVLASGVAGNEELGYSIRTKVLVGGAWTDVTINGQVATGLLSPQQTKTLLESQASDIHDFVPPQLLFLKAAERINAILHIGGINKNERAKTMAALLLSVIEEPPSLETKLSVLINDINTRSAETLAQHGKPEFAPFVHILPPSNTTNHVKFKAALVKTMQELQNLNIRSAMNSSTDVLGQFYEVFLKVWEWNKEIGVVLTPRHITRFAVDAIGVSSDDIVYDPCCGTEGPSLPLSIMFDATARRFKKIVSKNSIYFGIEQESAVAALAIVNMIFRGDGKNNIEEGNAFSTFLKKKPLTNHVSASYTDKKPEPGNEGVTRVLMNPPFALKGSTNKDTDSSLRHFRSWQMEKFCFPSYRLASCLDRVMNACGGRMICWRSIHFYR